MREVHEQYFDREDWSNIWKAIEATWPQFHGTKSLNFVWNNYQEGIRFGVYERGGAELDEIDADLLMTMIKDQTGFDYDRVLKIFETIIDNEARMDDFSQI